MVWGRLRRYRTRVVKELHQSLVEERSPNRVASSFSLGTFITMLPTLGTGLIVMVIIVALSSWVNKIALFAAVLVFNPVVKWGVYAASFSLGVILLGPVDGMSTTEVSLSAGPSIVVRLLVGNLILAVLATVLAYVVAYRVAVAYDRSPVGERIEEAIEVLAEDAEVI